ncbi:MAG: T9SS type A sorting domain-containing protein [Bacteroidetes bacterium]|nr:T9SS type A sorting domain-containing protein [Bacteroidota bacterium]
MKKRLLSLTSALLVTTFLMSQGIQNPGFEDWEDAGTVIDEPVNWSSIKTSDGGSLINNAAPVVWGQSNDAHSGNYSVELTNVLTLGTIIATGTITNGRAHAEFDPNASFIYTNPDDPRWHTSYSGRPDSIAVWAKYSPIGNDTAQIKVLLHVEEGTLPPSPDNQTNHIGYAQINITGTVDTWTRFAAPFSYSSPDNPEYILFVLTSGAGTLAVEGSKVFYDDLQLIGGPSGTNDRISIEAQVYEYNGNFYLNDIPKQYLKDAHLQVLDLYGRQLWSKHLPLQQTSVKHPLKQGLYILKIGGKEGFISQKIYIR